MDRPNVTNTSQSSQMVLDLILSSKTHNPFFVTICGSLNVVLNFLLILVIIFFKLDRDTNRFMFIAEFACGSVIFGSVSIIQVMLVMHSDYMQTMCKVLLTIKIWGIQDTCLNLTAVVVDQYIFIACPLKYHQIMSRKRACVLATVLKAFSIFSCILVIILWDNSKDCDYLHNLPGWHHAVVISVMLVVPLTIIVFLQILTIRLSSHHMRQIQSESASNDAQREIARRHRNGVITTALICVLLVVTWLPPAPILIAHFGFDVAIGPALRAVARTTTSLYYAYGLWTPLIYATRSPELRAVCLKLRKRYRTWRNNE